LSNLIGNSIKYSDEQKPDQFVQVTTENLQHKVRISVTDNGEGIEEDQKDKIFEMYYRGSLSSDGSGLGLFLVKEFLKRLYGKISFKSTRGEGTIFHIDLPLK
jgi:signal transduction histidine kinase